jgi:hypothetical protein
MSDVQLSCECGLVKGLASNITPDNGNHVVCCCCDCQAFAHHLDKQDSTLDECGGTRLFQTSQSQVKITQGAEKVACLRLTKKGITRWYTTCCNTPLGNTVSGKVPFIGIISSFIQQDADTKKALGPVRAYVQTQYATQPPSFKNHNAKFGLGITLRIMTKILGWKIRGMGKPSAFYDERGKSVVKPIVLK